LLSEPGAAIAQSFEVASIKVSNAPPGHSSTNSDEAIITVRNTSLQSLIQQAFDVRSFSLSGPDWLNSVRFDISAKFESKPSPAETRLMMQSLLKERFGLAIHHESKTLQGYGLVIAKPGLKLSPVGEQTHPGWDKDDAKLAVQGLPMSRVAEVLARQLDQPVSDMTETKGLFNFTLTYSSDPASDSGPSIFTALQEQLGLRLEARKVPVDVVVVDHVERTPTEN
jgi:uncharacterized protein (TIGR03435 family)